MLVQKIWGKENKQKHVTTQDMSKRNKNALVFSSENKEKSQK
jgi:hypothetical protein